MAGNLNNTGFLVSIATLTFPIGIKKIGPQNASLFSTFEPVTSVVLGIIIFQETVSMCSVSAIIYIIVSATLLVLSERQVRDRLITS
ncbi:MAG: EamA family transporter [Fastidiosipilaceae bacterium]|jgi:drug/metabolite transporter (DMT)-like permease|nr:EamA family transporter [Clostridiaceae bacterium]